MCDSSADSGATGLETLDTTGLLCPLPVIRTQDFVKARKSKGSVAGLQLLVIASDPGAMHDVPAWCRVHGHKVLAAEQVQQGDQAPLIQVRIALSDG